MWRGGMMKPSLSGTLLCLFPVFGSGELFLLVLALCHWVRFSGGWDSLVLGVASLRYRFNYILEFVICFGSFASGTPSWAIALSISCAAAIRPA
ncbi:hypothetical protein CEXT_807331 [Caerostris extrusa]|uniref:Secreted protein n=1 Tax=Caerostris extrusa TaxID=172846 RepID=A0AAV4XL23_CAEEX|nr:hypothetical protein CEXT_807331 [Caerostris extrusa]